MRRCSITTAWSDGGLDGAAISELARKALPAHIPTLDELYATCGTSIEISLDVKDPAALPRVVAVARAAGGHAPDRLWLCHPDWRRVAEWRRTVPDVRLVDSTRFDRVGEGLERRAASLADAGVDAINLHHSDWTGGRVAMFHRFEVLAFGWDAQQPRILDELLDCGIDGVYSDHVDRMVDALSRATAPEADGPAPR